MIDRISADYQVSAVQATPAGCYWSGTSPLCSGSCKTGEFVKDSSSTGDGARCGTGKKKLCCPTPVVALVG